MGCSDARRVALYDRKCMTVQVPTRMANDEVARLDELIEAGVGSSRSEVIRSALAEYYDRYRRSQIAQQIVASYTETPQDASDDGWASDSLDAWLGSDDATG